VVGRTSATDVSRLIEEVARGERELSEIRDEKLREIVRLALRLHKDPFSAPDAAARNRIRRRVMGSLRPHRPSLADRFVIAFTLLAKPTPYALRAVAVALVVVSLAGGTLVASADALPDDALYPVKIATEQVRLALATTSQDRAVVELSIAEHRLAEATVLAEDGDDDDAVIATSAYSEHLANAAAELAGSEAVDPRTADLVSQLQDRMNEHRAAAAKAASRLGAKPSTANAGAVLAAVASSEPAPSGLSPAAAIAADAANTAEGVASVAEKKIAPRRTESPRSASARPAGSVPSPAVTPGRADATQSAPASAGSQATQVSSRPSQTVDPRAARAADAARKAADEAKAAAQKAKDGGSKKSGDGNRRPSPSPTQTRR